MLDLFVNGRYISNGEILPSKNYPNGCKTSASSIIEYLYSNERKRSCIIGQKIASIAKRCCSDSNITTETGRNFLKNGQIFILNNLGASLSGKWKKEGNILTVYKEGFSEVDGIITKQKSIITFEENSNDHTIETYNWKCKKWVLIYKGKSTFVAPLDC